MFGESYGGALFPIADAAGYNPQNVSTPRDVWRMYFDLMESWGKGMGKDVADVLRYQSMNEMESMSCTECPLYEVEKNSFTKKSE